MRTGRPPQERFCDGCGESMGVRAGHVCASCWASCKIFLRYLREWLGAEPLYGDMDTGERKKGRGSAERIEAARFQSFGGNAR